MHRDYLTVITPTGDRPEAFDLCRDYIARQTRLPDKWIIVDDGKTPMFPVGKGGPSIKGVEVHYIIRAKRPNEPFHTLPLQLDDALMRVSEVGFVLVMEDDDWYHPTYCERMLNLFCQFPGVQLVGQAPAIYYHVQARRIFKLTNRDRASLCQTGFSSNCKELIQGICRSIETPFIDLELWKQPLFKFMLPSPPALCVGIKGMPGRVSTQTIGHKANHSRYRPDPDMAQLRELIGDDVANYEKFYRTPTERPL